MNNHLEQLNFLYKRYENILILKHKTLLLKKITLLENNIIRSKDKEKIIFFIIKSLPIEYNFKFSRYMFILSKLKIPTIYENDVITFLKNLIEKDFLNNSDNNIITSLAILTLKNFKNKDLDKFLFKKLKNKKSKIYLREIIITLSEISSDIETLDFFISTFKNDSSLRSLCFIGIGKISNYKNRPFLKRKFLNEFLKYSILFLKRKNKDEKETNNLYFSLIEICKVSSGLKGELLNNLLEILQLDKQKNSLKTILINIINNN